MTTVIWEAANLKASEDETVAIIRATFAGGWQTGRRLGYRKPL
jgi:hypothetical protein